MPDRRDEIQEDEPILGDAEDQEGKENSADALVQSLAESPEDLLSESGEPKKRRTGISTASRRVRSKHEQQEQEDTDMLLAVTINASIANRQIVEGTIAGVKSLHIRDQELPCSTVIIENRYLCLIPYTEMFMVDPMSTNDEPETAVDRETIFKRREQILRNMMGARITYIPTHDFLEGNVRQIVGSRREALFEMQKHYYFGTRPLIKEGETHSGTVITVQPYSALLNLFGYEQVVPLRRITNRYIPDLREYLKSGQKIDISVKKLEIDKAEKRVSFRMDCITAELLAAQDRITFVQEGDSVFGTLSKITHSKGDETKALVYGWLEEYSLPFCATAYDTNRWGLYYKIGDTVVLRVIGHDDLGYVRCRVLGLQNRIGY